ncbi:phosphatase PAP2 family protein [Candidatus Micrarchaeota archaeon]|nr:phosphatase PAP2 family protein [Candidatus Micrarchaeota archaeon]
MDFTLAIAGLNNGWLTAASVFIDKYWALCLILMFIPAMLLTKRRLALVMALLLAVAILPLARDYYGAPRPCLTEKTNCVFEPGFPSAHATTAFIFVAASIGTPLFLVFLPLGLFTAFSRVYLGVHSLEQIAGGIALGIILFVVSEVILKKALPLLRKDTGLV